MLKKKIFFYVWDGGGGFFHKTETKKSFFWAGGVSVLKLRTPLKPKFCSCSKPESSLKKRNRKNSPKIKPLRTSYYYLLLLLLSPFAKTCTPRSSIREKKEHKKETL